MAEIVEGEGAGGMAQVMALWMKREGTEGMALAWFSDESLALRRWLR
jgi:hypothetical protein